MILKRHNPTVWFSRGLARMMARLARGLHTQARFAPRQQAGGGDIGLLEWAGYYLPKHFAKPPSAMHHWIADEMDRMREHRGVKVNLVGPRGGAKSTVGTLAAVLRAAVESREPYIWLISDTQSQAKNHLENVKAELSENYRLKRDYRAAAMPPVWWRSDAIKLVNGVVIEAYGAGQRLRGRRRGRLRPTLIVCDDLENEQHTASPRGRDASREWFSGTLLKAGTRRTNVLHLATALHRDALAMRLLKSPGWRSRNFPSVIRWPDATELWREWESLYCSADDPDAEAKALAFYQQNQQAMDQGAQVLWPSEEDLYTLMRMRVEGGVAAFEREKQGSPVDPERCEWPDEYFGDEVWFDEWPKDLRLRTLTLDPSKGADARHGDYSALVMLGVDSRGVLHVDADLARRPTPQMVADGVDHVLRFRPDAIGVEANQWQQLLAPEFNAECARRGALGVAVCEVHNHVSKATRIRRLGAYLSQRRLRFKRGSGSTELLVEQLRDFPLAPHDDGPDALEMAIRLAEEVWQGRREASDGLGDRLRIGA